LEKADTARKMPPGKKQRAPAPKIHAMIGQTFGNLSVSTDIHSPRRFVMKL